MAIRKAGVPILDMTDWYRRAPPKSPNQWVDGRSAKECARVWLAGPAGRMPTEVCSLLESHADFGLVHSWAAEPEVPLHFDEFPGEPRNTDLLVEAVDDRGRYLIAVEAKADEPFGQTVSGALVQALERRIVNPRSNGAERIGRLAVSLLGPWQKGLPRLGSLRYQLLTATAGAMSAAATRGVSRIILLVHEFVTDRTSDTRHQANARDLALFVQRLSAGAITAVEPGRVCGPLRNLVRSESGAPVELYLGKVVRNLRQELLSPSRTP